MCGIAGIRRYGDTPIPGIWVHNLMIHLQNRGSDACGIAIQQADGGIVIHKAPMEPWEMAADETFREWLDAQLAENAQTVLIHTRYATEGSCAKNENNHPMWDGRVAVIHNGGIFNHDTLFRSEQMERTCETDSDVIRALVAKYGMTHRGVRELSRMNGSCAAACISTDRPGELLLLKSGSPMQIGTNREFLVFASTREALQKGTREVENAHGVDTWTRSQQFGYTGIPEDSAWLFTPQGKAWHQEFKACSHYTPPSYRACWDADRKKG